MDNFLDDLKASIKKELPSHKFAIWMEPLSFIDYKEGSLYLSCPNSFTKNKIETCYRELIEKEAENKMKVPVKLFLTIEKRNQPIKKDLDFQKPIGLNSEIFSKRLLRNDFIFDNFIVGKNNQLAYSAALSLASKNKGANNCGLFILSKTGLGKTHLSQAVGHHILSCNRKEKIFYITAEDFTTDMVYSIKNNSLETFKEKYRRNCDVLLIEDVHFFSGKQRSQEELISVLDMLFDSGKKVIFTSQYLPGDIPKISDKLSSRFSYALVSDISSPDYKTRYRILKNKAKINRFDIPDDVIEYVASELTENIRQLESGLWSIVTKASLMGANIDISLAESVIKLIVTKQREISVHLIKKIVCKHYGITVEDITSKSRKKSFVRPRQVAMFLSRQYTDQSLATIGKNFNRMHATVLHSINSIESGKKADNALLSQIRFFSDKLDHGDF